MKKESILGCGVVLITILILLIACGGAGTGTFTVGGTVVGLKGTLVLQNNGGDDLTITENGAFSFPTVLEDGSSYSVTVLTAPALQNCTLYGENGTIDGADITDVLVWLTDRWNHPTDLSDYISLKSWGGFAPQVAMDNNDNAIIVWWQGYFSDDQIRKSEYRNGSWTHTTGTPDKISPSGLAQNPKVAMDDNGNVIIVWVQFDNSVNQICMSEYRNGSWSHPANRTDNISPDGEQATTPQVAMDNNGDAIIVWKQYDGSIYRVFMSEYRNGSWNHPADLTDNISLDGHGVDSPQVAMDNNGNAIIVWAYGFMSEYRNGSWSHPADLSDKISPDGQIPYRPQVAMDNNGDAIIVWDQSDGSNSQVFMSEYRNGSWSHPTGLSDNISPDGQDTWYPQVAIDDNGNSVIVWYQSDGSNSQIFMSEYRNGSWSHPTGLSDNISPDGRRASFPQVAMDDNGNAVIVWDQSDGSNDQIFMSEYRNGSWSHPTGLSDNISPDGRTTDRPQVAMDNNGNVIIVWQQYVYISSSIQHIFMSEFR